MAAETRSVVVRLSMEAAQYIREAQKAGKVGSDAMSQVETGAKRASAGVDGLGGSAKGLRNQPTAFGEGVIDRDHLMPEGSPSHAELAARSDQLPIEVKADIVDIVDCIAGMSQAEKVNVSTILRTVSASTDADEGLRSLCLQVGFLVGRLYRLSEPAPAAAKEA